MEIFEALGINWKILIGQILNFLVLFYLMKRFVFGPFLRILEQRKEKIDLVFSKEKEIKEKLLSIEKEKEKILKEAEKMAQAIIREAEKRAKKTTEAILEEAQKTKEEIIAKAKKTALNEIEAMKNDFYQKNLELVFLIVEKFLKEKLTKEKDKEIIKKLLKENEIRV